LLTLLQTVLTEEGSLSGLIIDERDGMPSSSLYRHRFGSLLRAYSLIGYLQKLISNDRVARYLAQYQPELLIEFQKIADMTSPLPSEAA
jgi:hypothetical protein